MKEMVRYGLTLALICVAASASLAGMNSLTKPKIIAQAQAEEMAALKEVLPQAEEFEPVKSGQETAYYKAFGRQKEFIGVVFKASGKGYSSTIDTVVGMLKDGTINAIKVLSQNETPGLGANVAEPGFTGRFSNQNLSGINGIQAITGATISSKAVINSVKSRAEEIQGLIKDGR